MLNGPGGMDGKQRYVGNLNLSFAYVEGESLLMGLKVRNPPPYSTCSLSKHEHDFALQLEKLLTSEVSHGTTCSMPMSFRAAEMSFAMGCIRCMGCSTAAQHLAVECALH